MSFFSFLAKLIPWRKSFTGTQTAGGLFTGMFGQGKKPPAPPEPPAAAPINDDFLHSGTWLHLASSNVEAMRYLWDVETLEVEFKGEDRNGEAYLYQYFNIPPHVAHAFTLTASPGRFVWNSLRDRYPYVRMHGFAATAQRTPTVVREPSAAELRRKGLFSGGLPSGLKPSWMK